MGSMVSVIIWVVATYFIAKTVGERYPELEINPIYYALGTFLVGYVIVGSFLWYKVANYKNNTAGKIISIVLGVFAVVVNITYLLG